MFKKKANEMDVSMLADLLQAIKNLIALENHLYSEYVRLGKDEDFKQMLKVRDIRRRYQQYFFCHFKMDDRSEFWCEFKHRLEASMRLQETAIKVKGDFAKDMIKDAYEIEAYCWKYLIK